MQKTLLQLNRLAAAGVIALLVMSSLAACGESPMPANPGAGASPQPTVVVTTAPARSSDGVRAPWRTPWRGPR